MIMIAICEPLVCAGTVTVETLNLLGVVICFIIDDTGVNSRYFLEDSLSVVNLFLSIPHSQYLTMSTRYDPVNIPVTIRHRFPNSETQMSNSETRNPEPGSRNSKTKTRDPESRKQVCLRSRCGWTTSLSPSHIHRI